LKSSTLTIGKITSAHGIRGELKIQPWTDDMSRFDLLDKVTVRLGKTTTEYDILQVRYHKNQVLLTLKGIEDKSQADALRTATLEIPRELGVTPEDGRYLIVDLLGMEVYEDGKAIGTLKEVFQHGAADLYVIQEGDRTWMLPATKENILQVNVEENRMDIFVPEGLRDL
jgi:16S rRNA processing protein RimM